MRIDTALVAVALSTLLGCGGGSSGSTSPSPVGIDKDGDGFTDVAGDCNDQNAAVNPSGTIVVQASWVSPVWDCPRGSHDYTEDKDFIRVRLTNNKCSALSITDATVQTTVREAHGTFNFPGETWTSEHVPFSPNSIAMGVGGDILVDGDLICTNGPGGNANAYNVYEAEVTLQTSAGPVKATTTNRRTTRFPLASDAPSGVSGLQGTRPGLSMAPTY